MAVEVEDDVFFADLSKQIAMLITEDEEDQFPAHSPPFQAQEIPYYMLPHRMMTVPSYMNEVASYRRESRGTGVFIPKSTPAPPRRKSRSKRSSPSMEVNSPIQRSAAAAAAAPNVTNSSSTTAMHLNHGCYCKTSVLKRHE